MCCLCMHWQLYVSLGEYLYNKPAVADSLLDCSSCTPIVQNRVESCCKMSTISINKLEDVLEEKHNIVTTLFYHVTIAVGRKTN